MLFHSKYYPYIPIVQLINYHLFRLNILDYEQDIYKATTTVSDSIFLRQELKLSSADCTFLFADLDLDQDSVFDKPNGFLLQCLRSKANYGLHLSESEEKI